MGAFKKRMVPTLKVIDCVPGWSDRIVAALRTSAMVALQDAPNHGGQLIPATWKGTSARVLMEVSQSAMDNFSARPIADLRDAPGIRLWQTLLDPPSSNVEWVRT